jgi:hypothetical protein
LYLPNQEERVLDDPVRGPLRHLEDLFVVKVHAESILKPPRYEREGQLSKFVGEWLRREAISARKALAIM